MNSCPACTRDVPDEAQTCPYCGVIFAKWKPRSPTTANLQSKPATTTHVQSAKDRPSLPIGKVLLVVGLIFVAWLIDKIDPAHKRLRLEVIEFKCEAVPSSASLPRPSVVARGSVRNASGESLELRAFVTWEFDELQANKTPLTEMLGTTKPQTFGAVNPSPLAAGSVGKFEVTVNSAYVEGGGKCKLEPFEDSKGRRLDFTRVGGGAR